MRELIPWHKACGLAAFLLKIAHFSARQIRLRCGTICWAGSKWCCSSCRTTGRKQESMMFPPLRYNREPSFRWNNTKTRVYLLSAYRDVWGGIRCDPRPYQILVCSQFFFSVFPHRHKLTLLLSLPHYWFHYHLAHLLPTPHLPCLTLKCKCRWSCIDIRPWQMKYDRGSHARTSILMISVICQVQERQQEEEEDRSMVMMMMKEDLGCILALAEEWKNLDFPEGETSTLLVCGGFMYCSTSPKNQTSGKSNTCPKPFNGTLRMWL